MIEPVVLCWASPGTVSNRFMDSVLRLMTASSEAVRQGIRPDPAIRGYSFVESGPRIASARNRLVRDFLANPIYKNVEWLLMLDSDMTFDENLLPALFEGMRDEAGKVLHPIVGGLCFGGGHDGIFPTMYEIVDPASNNNNPVKVITEFFEGEQVQVDATGAACLLVHRGVYEHLATIYEEPSPWFSESVYKGHEFGEDWTFCLRARSQGFEIQVNTAAKVGHMKSIKLTEETWRTGTLGLKRLAPPLKLVERPLAPVLQMNRESRRKAGKR